MKSNLIRKINMECPLCDRIHEIEERTRETKMIVKGKEVKYMESYYFCPNIKEDENEFVTVKMLNDNLAKMRDAREKSCNS